MRRISNTLASCRAAAPDAFSDVLLLGGTDHYPEMIRKMLVTKGFDVVAAASPSDLEEKAAGRSSAVAIVDSDSTTWSPSATLKIPVVALTADATPNAAKALRKRGFETVITKPFIPEQFLAVLRRYASSV